MPTYPLEGSYAATGLPLDDLALFRAWHFWRAHRALQPAAYQNDGTLKFTRRLIANGERNIATTGGALLCMMPADLRTPISRGVSPETAAAVEDFARHRRTRFAYLDQASAPAQKIALTLMMEMMEGLQKKGDATLAELSVAAIRGSEDKIELKFLPEPRAYLLAADKTQGTTGNDRLENVFIDAALEYQAYYQSYLEQLLASPLMPPAARSEIGRRLQGDPPLPRLHETAIPLSDEMLAVYAQIGMDPRVSFDRAVHAIRLTEIIADSGETAPAMLAAAFLHASLAAIGPTDAAFLEQLGAGAAVDILRDNAEATKANLPLAYAPISQQQIELAQTILFLRDGQDLVDHVQARLDGPLQSAAPEVRAEFAAKTLMGLQPTLQELRLGILQDADALDCPALAEEAQAQMRLLSHMMERIGVRARLTGPQPQRRPQPGF